MDESPHEDLPHEDEQEIEKPKRLSLVERQNLLQPPRKPQSPHNTTQRFKTITLIHNEYKSKFVFLKTEINQFQTEFSELQKVMIYASQNSTPNHFIPFFDQFRQLQISLKSFLDAFTNSLKKQTLGRSVKQQMKDKCEKFESQFEEYKTLSEHFIEEAVPQLLQLFAHHCDTLKTSFQLLVNKLKFQPQTKFLVRKYESFFNETIENIERYENEVLRYQNQFKENIVSFGWVFQNEIIPQLQRVNSSLSQPINLKIINHIDSSYYEIVSIMGKIPNLQETLSSLPEFISKVEQALKVLFSNFKNHDEIKKQLTSDTTQGSLSLVNPSSNKQKNKNNQILEKFATQFNIQIPPLDTFLAKLTYVFDEIQNQFSQKDATQNDLKNQILKLF